MKHYKLIFCFSVYYVYIVILSSDIVQRNITYKILQLCKT